MGKVFQLIYVRIQLKWQEPIPQRMAYHSASTSVLISGFKGLQIHYRNKVELMCFLHSSANVYGLTSLFYNKKGSNLLASCSIQWFSSCTWQSNSRQQVVFL